MKKGFIRVTIVHEVDKSVVESYDWGPRAEKVMDKKVGCGCGFSGGNSVRNAVQTMLVNFCDIYGSKIWAWPKHAELAGVDSGELERMRKAAERQHIEMIERRGTDGGTTTRGSGDGEQMEE